MNIRNNFFPIEPIINHVVFFLLGGSRVFSYHLQIFWSSMCCFSPKGDCISNTDKKFRIICERYLSHQLFIYFTAYISLFFSQKQRKATITETTTKLVVVIVVVEAIRIIEPAKQRQENYTQTLHFGKQLRLSRCQIAQAVLVKLICTNKLI